MIQLQEHEFQTVLTVYSSKPQIVTNQTHPPTNPSLRTPEVNAIIQQVDLGPSLLFKDPPLILTEAGPKLGDPDPELVN